MNNLFSGRRVLLVEDEPIVAWLLNDMLSPQRGLGLATSLCLRAQEDTYAEKGARAHVPDAVLLRQMENSGNSKNATALRQFDNADETVMFLNPGAAAPHRPNGAACGTCGQFCTDQYWWRAHSVDQGATTSALPIHDACAHLGAT